MSFSIIIPCFNSSQFLAETLQSCVKQGMPLKQIVVVDDHSEDNSADVVREWIAKDNRVELYTNPRKGACSARNEGFRHAHSDFIQWLDADDILGPNKLSIALEFHKQHPRKLLACPWRPFSETLEDQDSLKERSRWNDIPIHSEPGAWIAADRHMVPHCFSGHRSLFEEAGTWDESLLINQDGEYFSRVVAASEGVSFTQDIEVHYRRTSANSVSSFTPDKAQSLFSSIEKMVQTGLSIEDSERMRVMASNRWQSFVYTTYPSHPELRNQAMEYLTGLPKSTADNPLAVSALSKVFCSLFGWKALVHSRRIRSKLKWT